MPHKKEETASFMVRFTQKIYADNGAHDVQWRGSIRHVQSGEESKFTEINDALAFIQTNLAELTKQSITDKSPEVQEGILSKSFGLWKKVTTEGTKLVLDTIKDPMKQVEHVQESIQDRYETVKDEIGKKLDIDNVLSIVGRDSDKVMKQLEHMQSEISSLHKKLDKLQKSKK